MAVLGDKTLKLIAQELLKAVRSSVTIDWTVRENVRASMRVIIKRILRKYGYPRTNRPRHRACAGTAEAICGEWNEK